MPDYKNMSAWQALQLAKAASGKTLDQIARGLGQSKSSVQKYFEQADGYFPGLDKIVPLCFVLGNRIILDWLEEQFRDETADTAPARSRAEVLTAYGRIFETLGRGQGVLSRTEEPGIYPSDAQEIRGIILDAEIELRRVGAMLAPLAATSKIDAIPLASMNVKKKKTLVGKVYGRLI